MDKYIGSDTNSKQTQGGNGHICDPQNRFHVSALPDSLKQSHQPIRAHQTAHEMPPKCHQFHPSPTTTALQPYTPLSANSARNMHLISAELSVTYKKA